MNGEDVKRKIVIIGAGFVGSSVAYALTLRNIAQKIVLVDIDRDKAEGEALDIRHGVPSIGDTMVYAGEYSDCADCDLIIITAGIGRKPGQSRRDLTAENIGIMHNVIESIKRYYSGSVILIISNPVDVLTYKVNEWLNPPCGRVFSSGCSLDTSRLVSCLANSFSVSTRLIDAAVIGEHGDAQVPVWSAVRIAGIPIVQYCEQFGIEWNEQLQSDIALNTEKMGAGIIKRKGKTNYGIATCACDIADSVVNNKPAMFSVSSILHGEYGQENVALSVPSIVDASGVSRTISVPLTENELDSFSNAANAVRLLLAEFE